MAAFMNTVRWYIYNRLKKGLPGIEVRTTYGAVTKRARLDMGLEKSHTNDAYAMGDFYPEVRAEEQCFVKRRRNNRCLEKFYDAKYFDSHDGTIKTGAQFGCQRTNRREPRMSDKNLRVFHGKMKTKGKRVIRTQRYSLRPGDVIVYNNQRLSAEGIHCNGSRVMANGVSIAIKKVKVFSHAGAWIKT